MKNKGFTIIELMVTFCLITVISFLLIELVLLLKDIYIKGDTKTILFTKQGNILKNINDDLETKSLSNLKLCSDNTSCLEFTYMDGEKEKLIVNKDKKQITYGSYSVNYGNNSEFGNIEAYKSTAGDNEINTITKISILINNKLIEEQFNFEVIIQSNDAIIDDDIVNFS